ncbi:LysR family transcriptional regulator [Sphingomonas sp. CLY1604]|uniref:LysR family transcriptional regulator n=1 Tax=Sphingomonas sp. CLY1604 TaxID=3457786 RepID=UPI003FD7029A
MVDLRHIRYFTAVAETLHFGRAAERLHVTQPALSRQIAALESLLSVKLIDRYSRRVRLTHAGARFLIDARMILASVDQACRNAKAADAGEIGELTIGFMMHAAFSSVPALTRRLLAERPGVRLHLRETMPSLLVTEVLEGRFDAGISFGPGHVRGLATKVLHREPLCLAARADHRLAGRMEITPDDLADEPLIASPADVAPALHQAIVGYLGLDGQELCVRLEAQLQQTIVGLVAEGIGIALVPQSLRNLAPEGVVFRTLSNAPSVEHILFWRSSNGNPVLPPLFKAAEAIASSIG